MFVCLFENANIVGVKEGVNGHGWELLFAIKRKSPDFLGRFSEAVRLFESYKIPSLIVHKHSITRIS